MYLKKIISSGFKSFADRVTLTLDKHNITGIVGPNGSGKSNVIDAVRWVMGEQNAKMLRGEKSTDIIFSGSEKRKPQSMAEVTLVFDNSESSLFCPPEYRHEPEIALTRRIYRDGEREYYINKKPCRLKDIISFFSSSGLGGRSYSMIQQGQVDQILQAKPEQIREILEEAAGTSIFKKRRLETVKKLEQTRLNLSRVDDILQEVERQLEALGSQVEKAKRWQSLTAQLKENEVSLFAHSFHHHSQKLNEIQKKLTEEQLREIAVTTLLSELETRHAQLQEDLQNSDPGLAALNESIAVLREKLARHEAALLNTIKLVEEGGRQLENLANELATDETGLLTIRNQVEETQKALNSISDDVYRLQAIEEELSRSLEMHSEEYAVYERNLKALQEEMITIERSATTNELRIEALEKEIAKSQNYEKDQDSTLANFELEYSQSRILIEGAHIKAVNSQKTLDELIRQKNSNEFELRDSEAKLKILDEKHNQNRQTLMETRAYLLSLEEMLASATDCKSIAITIAQHNKFSQSVTCFSDLISFAEGSNDLPQPVLKAFEHWAERLVVDDQINLSELADFAWEKNLPPVAVSLLKYSSNNLPSKDVIEKNGLLALKPYLRVDSTWLKKGNLLDCLYWVNVENSKYVFENPSQHAVVFCSDGSVYSGGSDIIIGASAYQGTLSRRKKVEQLREKEQTLHSKTTESEQKLAKEKQKIIKIKDKIADFDQQIYEQNKIVLAAYSEHQEIRHKVAIQEEKIQTLRKERSEGAKRYSAAINERTELKQKQSELNSLKSNTKKALEDARIELEEVEAQKEEQKRQLDQAKYDLSAINSKEIYLRETYQLTKTQCEVLQEKFGRQKREYETLQSNIKKAKTDRIQLEKEIEEFVLTREVQEKELANRKDANASLVEELRSLEKKIQECHNTLQKCQKIKSDCAVEGERAKSVIKVVEEQTLEKYQINLSQHPFTVDPDFKQEKISKKIASLKAELDQIGPINMIALDEYEELTERKEFILGQKEEIQSAIDLLETAVDEIEDKSVSRFMETFHSLNKEFSELFPILFPRGEGQIQLTDTQNPLEAGVEIMVRLPGKNRQNMRLFSGGEKALTAIALIFALLKSKPTPFCFLDEVDAPLDETNVGRYNHMLEVLADKFQFIVITHRRKTMEVLDTLYGVTMQEPGVSKVVGVDLAKALPAHLQKAFSENPKQTSQELKREGATAD